MLHELTATQLEEVKQYDFIDPVGEQRADFRMAVLASLMVNIAKMMNHSKRQPKPKMTEPKDFMPEFGKTEEERQMEQTEKLKRQMLALAAAFGAEDKREK